MASDSQLSSLKGKTVLITGGSRGIGRCISELFAENGARVFVVYRVNADKARQCVKALKDKGHRSFRVDITKANQVTSLFEKLSENKVVVDFLINNAGIGYHHPIEKVSYAQWQKGWNDIIGTNLIAPANLCYHAAQHMIGNGGGKIINNSSRGAFRGEPLMPAYGASKAGLNAMTQSLAYQLAPHNIFVGAIAPGFVQTDMTEERLKGQAGRKIAAQSPMNRVATPEEIAEATYLMALGNIWMTGAIIDVNGASYLRT